MTCQVAEKGHEGNVAMTNTRPNFSKVGAERRGGGPLIDPSSHESIGTNIQGPSVIATPSWVPNPLGQYYLYFADHKGSFIRLAYSDDVAGPYTVYEPGSLQLSESHFPTTPIACTDDELQAIESYYLDVLGISTAQTVHSDITTPHIASPDVHVDHDNRQIIMYFHGLESLALQQSRVAVSDDGISFNADPKLMSGTYLRAFSVADQRYCLTMPGQIWKLGPGLADAETGPKLFNSNMRHSALVVRDQILHVFYTEVGDAPECIKHCEIDVRGDWMSWAESETFEILRPELEWEGSDCDVEPSKRSVAPGRVNQLRDPAFFHDEGRDYLFYSVAGESGIALVELSGLD